MAFAPLLHLLGWALIGLAGSMLLPVLVAIATDDRDAAGSFLAAAVLTGFAGGLLALGTRGRRAVLRRREQLLLVALFWLVLPLPGAMPLYDLAFTGDPGAALFEAYSALTTTGATMHTSLDEASAAVLFWRALLQWLGGLLTVVLAVVALMPTGVGGLGLASVGLPHGEGVTLQMRLWTTLRELAWPYLALTVSCALALWLVGMSGFEATAHALSTLSTGGFSTRDAGIAAFADWRLELVLLPFMAAGGLNLTLLWACFNGRGAAMLQDGEVRYYAAILVLAPALLAGWCLFAAGWSTGSAARAVFDAVSILTTTGYSTGLPGADPLLPPLLSMALVLVGGCALSAAGGIRPLRIAVLLKHSVRELNRLSHPRAVMPIRIGQRRLDGEMMGGVWTFFFTFVLGLAGIALTLALAGLPVETALAGAIAGLTNAGPTVSAMAPDGPPLWAWSGGARAAFCAAMVLGRVELLALLILLSPTYWRR